MAHLKNVLLHFNLILNSEVIINQIKRLISKFFFADWSDEAVSSAEILRLIYQGRFLHGNVTLAALGLPTGKTTVMHLVPRESLPEPNSQGINRSYKCILKLILVILARYTHRRTLVENPGGKGTFG